MELLAEGRCDMWVGDSGGGWVFASSSMSLNGGWDVLGILVKSLGVCMEIFQIKNIIRDLMIGLELNKVLA